MAIMGQGLNAADVLAQLQSDTDAARTNVSGGFLQNFTDPFTNGKQKRAVAAERAMEQEQSFEQGLGLRHQLTAAGIDARAIPGLQKALQEGGQPVVDQLMQNPAVSPAAAAAVQTMNDSLQMEQQKQLKSEQAATRAANTPVHAQGRALGVVGDMKTFLAEEGRVGFTGASKGTYNAMRGQLLNEMRVQFEAGALQEAELKFFETLIPDASTMASTTQPERMAMLNELQYQWGQKLDASILSAGTGITRGEAIPALRSYDEITSAALPDGFIESDPAAEPPAPVNPSGGLSPFSGFLQQLGL